MQGYLQKQADTSSQNAGGYSEMPPTDIKRMNLGEGEKTTDDPGNIKGSPCLKPGCDKAKTMTTPVAHSMPLNAATTGPAGGSI